MGKVSKKNKHLSSEAEIPDSLSRKSQPGPFTFRYWDWEANGEFATASRSHPWRRSRPDRREHGGKWMWGGGRAGCKRAFSACQLIQKETGLFLFSAECFFYKWQFWRNASCGKSVAVSAWWAGSGGVSIWQYLDSIAEGIHHTNILHMFFFSRKICRVIQVRNPTIVSSRISRPLHMNNRYWYTLLVLVARWLTCLSHPDIEMSASCFPVMANIFLKGNLWHGVQAKYLEWVN